MEKLPKEFKEKWLEALRSGEYIQGKNYLRVIDKLVGKNEEKYCCLGVALLVAGVKPEDMGNCTYLMPNDFINEGNTCDISEILKDAYWEAVEEKRTMSGKLAEMNDNGNTFEEIAQYIDENL